MASIVSSIRIDRSVKSRIERAASELGMSFNEFVSTSASDRADAVLEKTESTPSNIDRILAAAERVDFPDNARTAASTIRDPFPGLREREMRLRK